MIETIHGRFIMAWGYDGEERIVVLIEVTEDE